MKRLGLKPGDTVFVPLCGKAVDLDWLCDLSLVVVGIELNHEAAMSVFARMGLDPEITTIGNLKLLSTEGLKIYVGDFFDLSEELLGEVHAVYDRAALVALPEDIRQNYSKHLASISGNATQLLISYDYDQSQTQGPPFSVPKSTIENLYSDGYEIELLESRDIQGPLTKRCRGAEFVLMMKAL